MAFQQGLSGLNAASKGLDVTSNNIANASTVGFKTSAAHFADIYASSLSGGGAGQVGIGVSVAAVQQQFSQGVVTSTNNPLDISINGSGFFCMDQNGAVSYTRNGQFHLDKNGYVINDQLLKLTGYSAQNGIVVPSNPEPIQISAADLSPVATGSGPAGGLEGVLANVNLDSRSSPPADPWVNGPAVGLWNPQVGTYNYSTAVSVYDSLGNPHTQTFYFVKTAVAGQWDVHSNIDGTTNAHLGAGAIGTLQFDTSGKLNIASENAPTSIDLTGVMADLGKPNSATPTLAFNVSFKDSTQFGSSFGVNRLEQDGYTAGRMTGLSVGDDGVVQGRYSNGQTRAMGQIVLANFTNPNGLQSMGNNQWVESSVSGAPQVGAPNTSSLGLLQSAAVEESNVDLTAELVNMITQQRNYQANAQSIKTQDQIMNTLVNLR